VPFGSLKLHPSLLKGIKELGFARPTPIQVDAIPPAIGGRDVLACAMTGSGKTAAFLLPILNRLIARPRGTTRALILTPTRELAAQILEELENLAVHTPITAAAVFGGVGAGPQEHAFRSGVDVIVATPGRLLDHLRQPYAKLDRIEHLVLDEADRMLDMGFLPDIRRVLRHLPKRRQTFFFSATMPGPILELTREMLHNPATINLERTAAPAVGITQAVYPVPQELKSHLLLTLLERDLIHEALVFTRTKHRANRLWEFLTKRGVNAARIHGNRSQKQRTEALAGFKNGNYRVLVATDIAARRHRRRSARTRRELRRSARVGRLHPSRGTHGARGDDRRCVHLRLAAGRGGSQVHRARRRQGAAEGDDPGLQLLGEGRGAFRGAVG
jgi:ATP-dependent RNA helicase RhlE